ncbi:MAG TPA: hypothetical protein PL085_11740 [Agriterribacter sp.]|uniref:HNH endonuclease n=1 Tax=Agriterribacter sp. TaxID=2821509 RepID=UPI002BE2FC44|nr:hypothetical protein [Agriterribacter sp.]HRQ17741.1 hypothetical protein [Agriterribacter sp.]
MNTTYSKALADPRWQRKKTEILLRDNFTCKCCGDTTTQLEVHHVEYFAGKQPWEYPDEMLLTTCHSCHEKELVRYKHEQYLLQSLKTTGFYAVEILAIAQMLYTFKPFVDFIRRHIKVFMKINDN